MVLKACDIQHFFHMREVKTAIYCCLYRCSALLLWSASPCPPSSSLAHDKRVIDSETDTLGCFLAAHQQQSLSSSFRSLSGLMKDRRWNSMAVIATVAPSLPPRSCTWPHSSLCSPLTAGSSLRDADPIWSSRVIFLGTFVQFQWDLCMLVHQLYQAPSVNIYGFVLHAQEPRSLYCSRCQWMYSFSKDTKKKVHSFPARLSLFFSLSVRYSNGIYE